MLIGTIIDAASIYFQLDHGEKVDYSALLADLNSRGSVVNPTVYLTKVGNNNPHAFKLSLIHQGWLTKIIEVPRLIHGICNLDIGIQAALLAPKVDCLYIGSSHAKLLEALRTALPIDIKTIGASDNSDINVSGVLL